MIVEVQEYSFKTGKGIAINPEGELISFTYKQLKDQQAIPEGKKAEIVDRKLIPATVRKSLLFYVYKLFNFIRNKIWQ